MKIRCKSCRKRFDPEVYSGLCPKCGQYQGANTSYGGSFHNAAAEEEHRKLHENYDEGYETAHPREEDDDFETDDYEIPSMSEEDFQTYGEEMARRAEKRRIIVKSVLTAAAVIVIPLLVVIAVRAVYLSYWEKSYTKEVMVDIRTTAYSGSDKTLVFEGGLIEYPYKLTVLGAGVLTPDEGVVPRGKEIVVVKISASCEGYNMDVILRTYCLKYEVDGKSRYKKPMSSYTLEKDPFHLGLLGSEIFSEYGIMSRGYGYCFFIVEDGAEDLELYAAVNENKPPGRVIQEGVIPLSDAAPLTFGQE